MLLLVSMFSYFLFVCVCVCVKAVDLKASCLGMVVHVDYIWVKFEYQDHWVKVEVTQ